jgi:hypothetical protein
MLRATLVITACAAWAACGDDHAPTPESIAAGGADGQHVEVTGQVHTVTFDSVMSAQRRAAIARHAGEPPSAWMFAEDIEESQAELHAYNDPPDGYPRTPDHYVLIRSAVPDGITFSEPGFNTLALKPAWGLGVHLTDIDPAVPMPEIGAVIKVTGTLHRVHWNQRDELLPIVDDAHITLVSGPPALAGPGEPCTRDVACNARLICDRASRTCTPPPREIYWADPWHDLNGACDGDADCPLGQRCETSYAIAATGSYAAHYFSPEDVGRHVCVLEAGATLESQCPRIYTARDLAGARFVTGKEICVRATVFVPALAADGDTHVQVKVDEPLPYPTSDAAFFVFGAATENAPMYKDPALAANRVADPAVDQEVVAIGTYRYDPGHGWYEMHPVKAYLPPPR